MYKEIKIEKAADVLVVTPLLPGHKISKETKIGLKRCDIPFSWVSFEGQNNIPTNVTYGMKAFQKKHPMTRYVILIDRDILPGRNMLRKMKEELDRSTDNIAYCYAGFEFKGTVNAQFYNTTFDPMQLLNGNYISSNSMIKYDKLMEIGGFITDNKYKRLLDWALWLKFLAAGYHGILCRNTQFVAISDENTISAGTKEDYREKYKLVKEDFVAPMLDGLIV